MRILIVEDEASIADRIHRMVLQITGEQKVFVLISSTMESAINFLKSNSIDLLLLDLNLNGSNGFQLLQEAVSASFHTIIISAYNEKAIEAFEYGVLDFIPKPFTFERLQKAFERFSNKDTLGIAAKYLAVKKQGHIEIVTSDKVKYIKATGGYSYLYLTDGTKLLHDKSLENLEMILQPTFLRIHRSYLLRIDEIKKLHTGTGSKYQAELRSGEFLPIGRTKLESLRKSLIIKS